jgi:uncharacterized oxidoreductase
VHADAAPLRRRTRRLQPREAALVAHNLVEANLTGHDSHGVGMLPRYVENLLAGGLKANQQLRIVTDHGSLLTLDGQAGYGQVMGHEAMALGIARARQHGVAVLGLANSHHIGRIGPGPSSAWPRGWCRSTSSTSSANPSSRPSAAATGASSPTRCAWASRWQGADPIVLDFATSRIAMGKVRVAFNKGEQVARHADRRPGQPTNDPGVMFREPHGALLPFGEHKGYGLAVACEILAGALSGGITLHAKPNPNAIINNMLSFIVDPDRLGTAARLTHEARAFADWVKASPPAPGPAGACCPATPSAATAASDRPRASGRRRDLGAAVARGHEAGPGRDQPEGPGRRLNAAAHAASGLAPAGRAAGAAPIIG